MLFYLPLSTWKFLYIRARLFGDLVAGFFMLMNDLQLRHPRLDQGVRLYHAGMSGITFSLLRVRRPREVSV